VVELHEATLVHQALLHSRQNTMHETKSVVKTWRNRLPCISDELSHWSDIFTWRQLHYQFVSHHFIDGASGESGSQTMLGVHASAQVQIHNFSVHQYCQVCLRMRIFLMCSISIWIWSLWLLVESRMKIFTFFCVICLTFPVPSLNL
jgi:transformation/transcription domain-associated protein